MPFTRKQKSDLGVWELTEKIIAYPQNSHQQDDISHNSWSNSKFFEQLKEFIYESNQQAWSKTVPE